MLDNDLSVQNAAPGAATRLQPVTPGERIPALDVMRGFALFGVLLAYALWNLGHPPEDGYGQADRALNWALTVLVDTKAYTLFAFLFGLGFAIQLTRAEARVTSIVAVYCRRLLALLAIGLAHATLLRNGDILVPYAVMGFVLLLFRNASNQTLTVGALAGLLFPYLARAAWGLTGAPFPRPPETQSASYLADNFAWVRYWYSIAVTLWPASLPMFLFGLYAGRRRFFENVPAHRTAVRRILITGLGLGLLAYAVRLLLFPKWPNTSPSFGRTFSFGLLGSAHAWGLVACYASALLLLWEKPVWRRWLAPLGAVGRMALTNYLLQAAIIVPVCLGFDLFDKVTPSIGLLLALAVWALQLPLSVWWLRRFRFGPAEWVWRSLTYSSLQPMRMNAALEARAEIFPAA